MLNRLLIPLLLGCCAALFAPTATAQYSNIDTVEGPTGEETTLTISPHSLTKGVSARALGIKSPNATRFALTLIGITRADSIKLTLGNNTLPIKKISRPAEDEVGPTRIYLSPRTFRTLAETGGARLHVGDETIQLPGQMRKEMRKIFETVM